MEISPRKCSVGKGSSWSVAEASLPNMLMLQMQNPADYTDNWPDVECTVKIKSFGHLNIGQSTFVADFSVNLDWLDFNLLEDVHFAQNIKNGRYNLSQYLLDTDQCFNPMIRIDNAVEDEFNLMSESSDTYPRIKKILRVQEHEDSVSRDVPWMIKVTRYRGTLQVRNLTADWFPLDVQRLPIHIVAVPLPGLTTMGLPRVVNLVDPSLRYEAQMHMLKKSHKMIGTHRTIAHQWPREGSMLGEMQLIGFGGQDPQDHLYQVDLLLIRRGKRYAFDFLIQVLQIFCALCSCWVPFNSDCLANRLSITLTVILTLVAFTTQRPAVIEELPYPTFHDIFEQWMVFFAVLVAVENLFVAILCWGFFSDDGDDIVDDWGCQPAVALGTSNYDMVFLFTFSGLILLFVIRQVYRAQRTRIAELLHMHKELHKHDADAATRIGLRMRRIRTAFPKDSFDIEITDIKQLLLLKSVVDVEKRIWVVKRSLTINTHRLLPGHLVGADNVLAQEACAVVAKPGRFPRSNSFKKIKFPLTLRVSEEDSQGTVNRLLVKLGEDFEPYDNITHFHAVKLMVIMPFPRCLYKVLLWFAKRAEQRMYRDTEEMATVDSDESLAIYRLNQGKKKNKTQVMPLDHKESRDPKWTKCLTYLDPRDYTFIVDIGTGEIGFYGYVSEKDIVKQQPNSKRKITNTFFADYVESSVGVEKFGDLAYAEFSPVISDDPTNKIGNVKIFASCTGANRERLLKSEDSVRSLETFLTKVGAYLKKTKQFMVDFLMHSPLPGDEAKYELRAVDFLVQQADLDVIAVPCGSRGQSFGGFEIEEALQCGRTNEPLTLANFIQEFRDLRLKYSDMTAIFTDCIPHKSGDATVRSRADLAEYLRTNSLFMRSLIRARLFCGTLAAGGGSSQFTFKSTQHLTAIGYHSIPVGNKKAMVVGPDKAPPMWPAGENLMDEDLKAWRTMVRQFLEKNNMPGSQRGFYVGISAVAHAAKKAGIANQVLPRDVFLKKMEDSIQTLDRTNPDDRLNFSNLIMVYELVDWILNDNAFIVCKREWELGGTKNFVATWSFGFWLTKTRTR